MHELFIIIQRNKNDVITNPVLFLSCFKQAKTIKLNIYKY